MFQSEALSTSNGPSVILLSAPSDPLGAIAACAKMYLGEVVRDLSDITDAERRHYLGEMKKTKLKMPLEAVQLHFMLEGVSRGFTHQLVRQRTAAFAQESMRFAVVEDSFAERVVLPPSLAGTKPLLEWEREAVEKVDASGQGFVTDDDRDYEIDLVASELVERNGSPAEKWRFEWDKALLAVERAYRKNVNTGMPAEDARGLLPTNIATRVNYITNFRGLLDHAGNRLCTQAQFEWRLVLAKLADSLRVYGRTRSYQRVGELPGGEMKGKYTFSSEWQFDALADLLRPVCYQVGSCVMKAEFDRKCSIRDRVDAFHAAGVPSSAWDGGSPRLGLLPIHSREWLADPGAAR